MSKNSLCNISAEVLPITKRTLEEIQETTGLSCGELIDRMVHNWHANDPETAAQLILDAISIHTRNLNKKDFNTAICVILSVIKASLSTEEPDPIKAIIEQIENTLPREV